MTWCGLLVFTTDELHSWTNCRNAIVVFISPEIFCTWHRVEKRSSHNDWAPGLGFHHWWCFILVPIFRKISLCWKSTNALMYVVVACNFRWFVIYVVLRCFPQQYRRGNFFTQPQHGSKSVRSSLPSNLLLAISQTKLLALHSLQFPAGLVFCTRRIASVYSCWSQVELVYSSLILSRLS